MSSVRGNIALAFATLAALCAFDSLAQAQDGIGSIFEPIQRLWSGEPKNALAYEATLFVAGAEDELRDTLKEASALVAGSDQGAPSATTLLAIAREEPGRLTAALYSRGYYSGLIKVSVAGQIVDNETTEIVIPEKGPIPVAITVEPGPIFHFGNVEIIYSGDIRSGEADAELAKVKGLTSGAVARSTAILETSGQLVSSWKKRGYAFASISSPDVTVDHATRRVDVAFTLDPGSPTRFGAVEIKGTERFNTKVLRSRADIPEGESYSPDALKSARKRLAKLAGVRGVRIIEGDKPDSNGRIPITIEITEPKAHYFGANAAVSSVDGAELGAYWGHRNVWGNGESLRFDAKVSNLGNNAVEDLEYEAKATLTRPSPTSAYTDYKAAFSVEHEEPDTYESDQAKLSFGAIHQFSPELTGEAALQGSWIQTEDAFGASEFFLLSVPSELVYDTRDNPFDASKGWHATITVEPAVDLLNSTSFISSYGKVSGYTEISKNPRIIAAGRIGAGTFAGADLEDVPATARFLGGGGGSVRGYAFRSIGPDFGDGITGGLSIVETSAELRFRINEMFGVVPFVDAAFVSGDSFFGGESETAVGAGLGLRYFSPIGPIRFDVAVPLDKIEGEPDVVFYVGLGQAF